MQKEIYIGGKYKLTKRLGNSGSSRLYAGVNTKTGEEVAVKLEKLDTRPQTLQYESKVYQLLQGQSVVPNVH